MAEKALDATNVGVAKGNTGNAGGYAWVGAVTDTLPTDAKTAIDAKFKSLGFISEDGLANATETESEDHKDWGGTVVKSERTSYTETYEVGFLESRETVLKAVYGERNVTSDGNGGITVKHNGNFGEEHSYIFESLITVTLIKRTVIPRGVINERDDVEENSSDLIVYKPTIKCLPDAQGNTSYAYYYDSSKAGGAAA